MHAHAGTCTRTHIRIYTRTHAHKHTHVHTDTHTHTCTHAYTHSYAHTHTHTHTHAHTSHVTFVAFGKTPLDQRTEGLFAVKIAHIMCSDCRRTVQIAVHTHTHSRRTSYLETHNTPTRSAQTRHTYPDTHKYTQHTQTDRHSFSGVSCQYLFAILSMNVFDCGPFLFVSVCRMPSTDVRRCNLPPRVSFTNKMIANLPCLTAQIQQQMIVNGKVKKHKLLVILLRSTRSRQVLLRLVIMKKYVLRLFSFTLCDFVFPKLGVLCRHSCVFVAEDRCHCESDKQILDGKQFTYSVPPPYTAPHQSLFFRFRNGFRCSELVPKM